MIILRILLCIFLVVVGMAIEANNPGTFGKGRKLIENFINLFKKK